MRTPTLLALLVLLVGCAGPLPPGVVAEIDGEPVRFAEFERFVRRATGEEVAGLDAAALSALFERFLEDRLLLRLAVERGLVGEEARLEEAREALEATLDLEIDDARVESEYRRDAVRHQRPETVVVDQILADSRAEAERALSRLEAGEPFAEVAAAFGPRSPPVALARDDLPLAFAEAVFALEEGEWTDVLTIGSHHVFYLVERRPAGRVPLAEAAPEIRRRLRAAAADEAWDRLVREARERYTLRVEQGSLPFQSLPLRTDPP